MAILFASDWKPDPNNTPDVALTAVRNHGISGKVLNHYNFGGYLISQKVPTFVDGRSELYGDEFLETYFANLDGNDSRKLDLYLKNFDIGWTLLRPDTPAAILLDNMEGWRRLYGDEVAVVHIRVRP